MRLHTAIPLDASAIKRNDIIRIREPRGLTAPVLDSTGAVVGHTPLEYVDVRVTGVKALPAERGVAGEASDLGARHQWGRARPTAAPRRPWLPEGAPATDRLHPWADHVRARVS